jgi:N-acetylglucosaminyl-diphospho-decaprenol L-rhamnosyltransferase
VPEPLDGITVVIVTYNSETILPWSLPPLAAHPEVVVVDNASADASVATVRRLLPQARVIEAGRNLGFGRASNLGLDACRTPLALIMNPDTRLEPGCLEALQTAAQRHPAAAVLAPVLFDAPGVVGDFFRGPFAMPPAARAMVRVPPDGDCSVEFVTGAAMLLRLEPMRQVGFFDPWFFLYHEDDDLCERVRRAGHSIVVAAAAHIEHRTRGSSRPSWRTSFRRGYCMTLSKLYLTRKRRGAAWRREALRIGIGSALALPWHALTLRGDRVGKQAARLAAALMSARHLNRAHCFEPAD